MTCATDTPATGRAVTHADFTYQMPIPFQIAYISTSGPGNIIMTRTPTGAGERFDLKPGDVIEIAAQGIGTLRNGAIDE